MDQQKRKQLGQTIFLVVLLVGLGFSVFHMINTVNRQSTSARTRRAQTAERQETAEATPTPPAATQTEAAEQPGATESGEDGEEPLDIPANLEMNPNLFRVYQLDPPKNPFVQKEEWYAEELSQVPGYPELRDIGFFDNMSPTIPELSGLLGEDDVWQEARLTKFEDDMAYTLSGESEDGKIDTQLMLLGANGRETNVEWRPDTGVPLTALSDPNWQQRYGLAEGGTIPPVLPSSDDLFEAPDGGLQIPGLDEVLTGGVVSGDQLLCHGVSGRDARATALVSYNGTTRLVGVGDSLPPRYQVQAITPDGVVLNNLRSGETMWLPLSAPTAAVASGGGSSTANMPAPAPIIPAGGGGGLTPTRTSS